MSAEKKTIVIGEDDHAIVEVVKIILQDAGYNPIGITEAAEIIKTIKKQPPALIFLDIWMSGEDGREIAKKIKNDKKLSHIPIVMISANNETEQIAKSVGADGFLSKPFAMEELIATVEKHLNNALS